MVGADYESGPTGFTNSTGFTTAKNSHKRTVTAEAGLAD